MGIPYATREDVKSALDIKMTARNDAQVDRALEAASRSVEGFLHRTFYPRIETKYFNWPNLQRARSWRLWLGHNELIYISSVTSGGVIIPATDYFLEPNEFGPPYDRIEIDLDSSSAFSSGGTHQRSIAITGTWGYTDDHTIVGTLAEALDASETGVDVDGATAAQVGVGNVLKVGSERMLITNRTTLSTGQTIQADVDHLDNVVSVPVVDGAAFAVGEVVLINAEKMRIVDISGNALVVTRAWDGSTLAAHTAGATVYAYRTLTVTRGALGTTAATHNSGATVNRWDVPGPVRELTLAEAVNNLLQANAGYARTAGSADNEREAKVQGLESLRCSVLRSHGRSARVGAV